jgi:hypothetical protein
MSHQIVDNLRDFWIKWRTSRVLILFIVFVALFLDNMLLTTVGKFSFQSISFSSLIEHI